MVLSDNIEITDSQLPNSVKWFGVGAGARLMSKYVGSWSTLELLTMLNRCTWNVRSHSRLFNVYTAQMLVVKVFDLILTGGVSITVVLLKEFHCFLIDYDEM